MPNGDDYLRPGDWSMLEAPLRDATPGLEEWAQARSTTVSAGSTEGMPRRAVHVGEEPRRMIEVRAVPGDAPSYEVRIVAEERVDWHLYQKQRVLARQVAPDDIVASFLEVADEAWAEVATWTVDDLEQRW